MTIIYIVTSGEYSDYSINAVFTTKELAEQYCTFFGGYIEEWEADRMAEDLRTGRMWYEVLMDRHGNTPYRTSLHYGDIPYDKPTHVEVITNKAYYTYGMMRTYVKAKNEQHAVKIANERRAKLIASGGWPTEQEPT